MSFYDALLFSKGQRGKQGYSAYEIAVQNGYEGTEEEWANSFLSPTGYYTKTETDNKLKKKAYYFDNVASMKNATNLKDGDYVITLGYYEANDGGGASYLIRAKTEEDVDDNILIIFIGNELVSEKIINKYDIKFKPKIYYSVNWAGQSNGIDYTAPISSRNNVLKRMKECSMNGFILPIQTKYNNSNSKFEIINDLDTDLEYALKSAQNGVPLHALKIHHANYSTSQIISNKTNFINNMKEIIDTLYNKFGEIVDIEYLTILNELTSMFINTENDSLIIELMNYVQQKGYKTGITSAGSNYFNRISDNILNASDIIALNEYVRIGSKRNATTVKDSINAWNEAPYNSILEYYKGRYKDKKFIISETGCMNYWEALQAPSSWNFTSEPAKDDMAQKIYYEGMFNQCKYVDEVWLWFELPDKSIFDKYLKGVN